MNQSNLNAAQCSMHKGMCPPECPIKMDLERRLQNYRPGPREILRELNAMQAENMEMAPNPPYIHNMRPLTIKERVCRWFRHLFA